MSPHAAAIYLAGFDAGIAAQAERVKQAEHDSDRFFIRAMHPAERAAEIERRLDSALDQMPDAIAPHSPDYFERALSGVLNGGTA
ncbi:hypothetical protein [Agrococcus beijingensis]|uniref:hypothetical protein n=1 Tax=Agrococcus beijingensis TaxID=3068634 RepID=UPI0027405F8D|nr:hypothetical protein [Agrococcus sp. REN33]